MRDNPPAESTTAAALTVAAVPTSLAIVVHAALAAGMTVAASARIRAKVFIDSIGGVYCAIQLAFQSPTLGHKSTGRARVKYECRKDQARHCSPLQQYVDGCSRRSTDCECRWCR